jgi:hypothetical protein
MIKGLAGKQTNLRVLDLSGCENLTYEVLVKLLGSDTPFPNLLALDLSDNGTKVQRMFSSSDVLSSFDRRLQNLRILRLRRCFDNPAILSNLLQNLETRIIEWDLSQNPLSTQVADDMLAYCFLPPVYSRTENSLPPPKHHLDDDLSVLARSLLKEEPTFAEASLRGIESLAISQTNLGINSITHLLLTSRLASFDIGSLIQYSDKARQLLIQTLHTTCASLRYLRVDLCILQMTHADGLDISQLPSLKELRLVNVPQYSASKRPIDTISKLIDFLPDTPIRILGLEIRALLPGTVAAEAARNGGHSHAPEQDDQSSFLGNEEGDIFAEASVNDYSFFTADQGEGNGGWNRPSYSRAKSTGKEKRTNPLDVVNGLSTFRKARKGTKQEWNGEIQVIRKVSWQ